MISLCPPYCGSFELDPLAVPTTVDCVDGQDCVKIYSTDCIIYHGTYFNCFGIEDGDSLTTIINVMSSIVFPDCTTTTTTVAPGPTTTSTTLFPVPTTTSTTTPPTTKFYNANLYNCSTCTSLGAVTVTVYDPFDLTVGKFYQMINGGANTIVFEITSVGVDSGSSPVMNVATEADTCIDSCLINAVTTTSTTSTTSTTTTSTTTASPFGCDCRNYRIVNNTGGEILVPYTDCITLVMETILISNGQTVTRCACLDSIPDFGVGFTLTDLGAC